MSLFKKITQETKNNQRKEIHPWKEFSSSSKFFFSFAEFFSCFIFMTLRSIMRQNANMRSEYTQLEASLSFSWKLNSTHPNVQCKPSRFYNPHLNSKFGDDDRTLKRRSLTLKSYHSMKSCYYVFQFISKKKKTAFSRFFDLSLQTLFMDVQIQLLENAYYVRMAKYSFCQQKEKKTLLLLLKKIFFRLPTRSSFWWSLTKRPFFPCEMS